MSGLKILIAEDEENFRNLLEKVLRKEGYEVYTASNGVEAVEVAKKNRIPLLLTDIKMSQKSGVEVLEELKDADPFMEAIIMTAFATVQTAVKALKLGARDYIIKPFKIEELIDSVKRAESIICENRKEQLRSPREAVVAKESEAMKQLMKLLRKVASSDSTIFISGETGVGKELVAKYIHEISPRKDKPFIKVNCSALPDTLLESELFGHEKGAFTGAYSMKPGRFELANNGTIFLDEVGDISPLIQLKLLRVIQEKEIERLGGIKSIKLDVRIITATNKDLKELVKTKQFREDLYYRINVIPVHVPSLRERKEDIKFLINSCLISFKSKWGKEKIITSHAMKVLSEYNWPGNIRELENVIERMVVTSESDILDIDSIPSEIVSQTKAIGEQSIAIVKNQAEEDLIKKTLADNNWNVTKSSEVLGISRRSLHRKIEKYHLHS